MALRTAVSTAATTVAKSAAQSGFKALSFYSTARLPFNFPPRPTPAEKPPPAEPSTNLFVSGLSKRTTSEGLRTAFEKFGKIVDARVVTDHTSGFSKGYGFVRYATLEEAEAGIKGMDGQLLDWWIIFAEYGRVKTKSSSSFQNGTINSLLQELQE